MKKLVLTALILGMSQIALGDIVVVDSAGAEAGDYAMLFRVGDDGKIAVQKVDQVIKLTDFDNDDDDDDNGDTPTTLEAKVTKWAKDVDDPPTAEKLSLGYGTIKQQIEAGTFKTKAQAVQAQTAVNKALTKDAAGDWDPFFADVNAELDRLEGLGRLNDLPAMAVAWGEISEGLENAADPASALTPDQRKELIQLIIQIILLIITGVG
jgi:hypothetical protein